MAARFSTPVQTGPRAYPASCTMGTASFPGGKKRPGRDADPSPTSSAVGHERVELYLYSPYGPFGLYRASVPVQGCTLPLLSCSIRVSVDVNSCLSLLPFYPSVSLFEPNDSGEISYNH